VINIQSIHDAWSEKHQVTVKKPKQRPASEDLC